MPIGVVCTVLWQRFDLGTGGGCGAVSAASAGCGCTPSTMSGLLFVAAGPVFLLHRDRMAVPHRHRHHTHLQNGIAAVGARVPDGVLLPDRAHPNGHRRRRRGRCWGR